MKMPKLTVEMNMLMVSGGLSRLVLASFLSTTLLLTGCSSAGGYGAGRSGVQQQVQTQDQIGTVSSIQIIAQRDRGTGGGAVLGAVLGGVLGNQFGSGSGRALATGAGLVGGAVAGNAIEQQQPNNQQIYRVTVELAGGFFQQFDYQQIGQLRTGDKVSIRNGQLFAL